MTQKQNVQCHCCRLSIRDDGSDHCPRCGYPVRSLQEREFLESALTTLIPLQAHEAGDARIDALTGLSEAMLAELQHLAKYGGANLRLTDLAQFSPWMTEGLRRIKSPAGPDMCIPEVIFTLERSVQWLRALTAQEWRQVQVAGVIPLSRPTIEQIQRIAAHYGSELRVATIAALTPSDIQDLQRAVTYVRPDIKTGELMDLYQSRLADLRAQDTLPTPEDQSKKTVDLPPSSLHSQPTGEITVQKQKAPEIAPQFTPSLLPAVEPSLPEPEPVLPPLVGIHFSSNVPASAGEPAPLSTENVATGPAPVPLPPEPSPRHPARRARPPRRSQAPRARAGVPVGLRMFIAESKAFMADSRMILTLLGAFLSLMTALLLVVNANSNGTTTSFAIALGFVVFAQFFFLVASFMTKRYTRFLPVARIYAFVFALLIPMFGLELFNLLGGNVKRIGPEGLIAAVSLYTAISFGLFAIYQKYQPFSYFGIVALWVADIAMAKALNAGLEWYPALLLLLALPSLISARKGDINATPDSTTLRVERLMAASPAILRKPVEYCMYVLVALCSLSIFPFAFVSLMLQRAGINKVSIPVLGVPTSIISEQVRFALFCVFALLLIWYSLYLWLAKKQKGHLGIAWLFLATALDGGYSLQFSLVGYSLIFIGLATLYHIVGTRFIASAAAAASVPATASVTTSSTSRNIASPERLALRLDQFALVFICITLFTSAYKAIPLFFKGLGVSLSSLPAFLQHYSPLLSPPALLTLLALCSGTALTVSIAVCRDALARARRQATGNSAGLQVAFGWPWLLLLAGLVLCWTYSVLIVNLPGAPAWWFLGLTLALVVITVVARQRAGSPWANPLDVVVLCVAITTILLNIQNLQAASNLLLFFAAFFYVILLWQRRQKVLFLPLLFALSALPIVSAHLPVVSLSALLAFSSVLAHPPVILLCALALPFVAAAVYRLTAGRQSLSPLSTTPAPLAIGWQWPITCFSLLCACILLYRDGVAPIISTNNPVGSFTASIEIAFLALVWYVCAGLTPAKWLLFPAALLAIFAPICILFKFWPLAAITVVAALAGLTVSRTWGRVWAAPLYSAAVTSAFLTGVAGGNPDNPFLLSAAWMLLGFVIIVHIIAIGEKQAQLLWLVPVLITWSIIDTLIFITRFPHSLLDLARVPGVALACVAAAVAISLAFGRASSLAAQTTRRLQYAAPLYTSALIAAILTGCYALYLSIHQTTGPLVAAISLALPAILLFYAAIASGVSRFERQAKGSWLVVGFGIWGILLAARINLYLVVATGMVTGIIGLSIGISRRLKAAMPAPDGIDILLPIVTDFLSDAKVVTTGASDVFKPFAWSWPWYVMTVVAAFATGVSQDIVFPIGGAVGYGLLAFAVLIYIIGYGERQPLIAFCATGFSAWACLKFAGFKLAAFNFSAHSSPQLLVALALLCVNAGVVMRLPGYRAHRFSVRAGAGQHDRMLRFALPLYATALIAAILTGVAPHDLSSFRPALLLIYAVISYGAVAFERRPYCLFIPAGFAAWGTLLISQNTLLLVTGLVAAFIGMSIKWRIEDNAPAPGWSGNLRKLLHTWAWPWYATMLIAAIIAGHSQTTGEWLSPANSLLIFAALACVIGLAEDLTAWLWTGSGLAIWSMVGQTPDPLRLIGIALISVCLGIIIRRSKVLSRRRAGDLITYALPFYITALVAALLTGLLYSATAKGVPDIPLVAQLLPSTRIFFYATVLLIYALIAFLVLVYEKRPLWLALVAAFGIWAIVLVAPTSPVYVLAIGLTCGIFGLLLSRVTTTMPPARVLPGFWQSPQVPFIRSTYSWPWYSIALLAVLIIGFAHPSGVENSLLLFAILAYVIGMVENQTAILYFALLLALGSAGYSAYHDALLRLFVDTLCVVAIAFATGLYARRHSSLSKRAVLFRYVLPLYVLALCIAVMTAWVGSAGIASLDILLPGGFHGSDAYLTCFMLLLYTALAYGVLRLERWPLGTVIVALFGAWGTIIAIQAGAGSLLLLAIGLIAGLMGIAHARKSFARGSVPPSPQFDETFTIDNI